MASANNVTYRRELRDESQFRLTDRLIRQMMPQYVKAEANNLVTFLEEYYKFLHAGGNPLFAAKNLFKLRDIDDFDLYKKEYEKDYIQRSTYSANSIQKYVNKPIVGPNVANGVTITWLKESNTATLSSDVANSTFTNGSVWYIGNTTPGPKGNHTSDSGIVVHDYNPTTRKITFTSKTLQAASSDTGVIRKYASNTNIRNANTSYLQEANTLNNTIFDHIRNEFLLNFPTPTQSAFKLLAKNIQSIYRAKGSKRGIETLFKGVFDREADVQLPFDNVLVASGGEFTRDSYLQATTDDRLSDFKNTLITGKNSLATAIVKDIIEVTVQGKNISKILLENISGTFDDKETISTPGVDFTPVIRCGFNTITLTSNGSGYSLGDQVKVIGDGEGGIFSVASTENFSGSIRFNLVDGGSGYRSNSIVTVTDPVGFTGVSASFVIGGISNTFILALDTTQVGALAANQQVTIGTTRWGTNFTSNSINTYAFSPTAGPKVSNGLNVSWRAGGVDAKLEDDVANNTFVNGASWMVGNNNSSNLGHFATLVVQDYYPGNSTLRFTSAIPSAASTNTAILRQHGANVVYTFAQNSSGISTMAYANSSYPIANGISLTNFVVGSIAEIQTIEAGKNYVDAPTPTIIDPFIQSFLITANSTTGGTGKLGENARVTASILSDNIITELNVVDHGVGYTEETLTLESPATGTAAIVDVTYGGVANGQQRYSSTKSFLSEAEIRLQDNDFYQSYAYELKTDIGLNDYKRFIISSAHPAGNKLFGRYFDSQPANSNIIGTGEIEARLSSGLPTASSRLNARPLGVSRLNKRI